MLCQLMLCQRADDSDHYLRLSARAAAPQTLPIALAARTKARLATILVRALRQHPRPSPPPFQGHLYRSGPAAALGLRRTRALECAPCRLLARSKAFRDSPKAALSAVQNPLPACFRLCNRASPSEASAFIFLTAVSMSARRSAANFVAAFSIVSVASRQAFT
jgi:hypothetical protein